MKNRIKLTYEQLKSMYDYANGIATGSSERKKDLKFYYHPLTPKDIYLKYKSYGVEPDGSIYSEMEVKCIKTNGNTMDCQANFNNLKERMGFESDFIEIDLDANGNVIFM
jgi:hypothetical protein